MEIIDSYTRKKWVLFLQAKSEIVTALDEWGNVVERQSGCLIIAIRSDNASEILKILKNCKRNNGVISQTTAPYSSHQNAAAERAIQSTVYATRAILKEARLHVEFRVEAARTHTYITNRIRIGPTVSKIIDEKRVLRSVSPEEAWTGSPVTIRHFRVFGCKAFAHIDRKSHPKHSRKVKLMDVGRECIFMGYTDTASQYRLYASDLHKVFTLSYTKSKENVIGSSIKDLRLWRNSGLELVEGINDSAPIIRNPGGRPNKIINSKPLSGGGSFNTDIDTLIIDGSIEPLKIKHLTDTDIAKTEKISIKEATGQDVAIPKEVIEVTENQKLTATDISVNLEDKTSEPFHNEDKNSTELSTTIEEQPNQNLRRSSRIKNKTNPSKNSEVDKIFTDNTLLKPYPTSSNQKIKPMTKPTKKCNDIYSIS